MDSKHQGGLPDDSTTKPLDRPETPPPQYGDIAPPPPRVFGMTNEHASHLAIPWSTGSDSQQRTSMEHIVNDAENRRASFDPQEPATWKGSKWEEIKLQWRERHQGPREPKDPGTGRGQFTGLTPEELKAKCENYGTLLPKGQHRR